MKCERAAAPEQAALSEQEKDRVRGLLFDAVAREFAQPLNLIGIEREYLALHLAAQGGAADAKAAEALDGIGAAVAQMTRLVNNCLDLLSCLQGQAPAPAVPLDLGALLADLCADSAEIRRLLGVTLTLQLPEEPCCILADPALVQRIVLNLLSNALRACDAGGHVAMTLCWRREGGSLAVEDDGCGVPETFCAQAFRAPQPDVRLNCARYLGGAGLGLYLVGETCRLLGWQAEMRPAKPGTCVTLRIPPEQRSAGDRLVFHSEQGAARLRGEAARAAALQELRTVPGLEKLRETQG